MGKSKYATGKHADKQIQMQLLEKLYVRNIRAQRDIEQEIARLRKPQKGK